MDPEPPAPARDPRARLVLVLSSLGALVVMLGVVGLAVFGSGDERGKEGVTISGLKPSPPGLGDPVPMPVGCVPDPARPPRILVDLPPAGIDFGKMKQGLTVDRRVTFRNVGEGPLCIRDVQTGCGCVKAHLEGEQRRFEPGESGVVVVTLDSIGRSGPQSKSFTLVTNELDVSRRTFPVSADVSLGVLASSHVLDLGRPRKGEPALGTIRLSSPKSDPEWTVTGLVAAPMGSEAAPTYTWAVKQVEDPNLRILDLSVTHPGRDLDGLWRAPVVVKLNHPERSEVALEAQLLILPPLQPTPPMAIFGFLGSGASAREIKIHLRPATSPPVAFEVLDAHVEPTAGKAFDASGAPFLVEQGQEPGDGTRYLVVRYDGRTRQPGLLEADLVIRTSVKEQPEIRIPLRATIAGSR